MELALGCPLRLDSGKLIKLILPFLPGTVNDVVARLIAPSLSSRLGQTVVVDNRPGGGTSLGTKAVMAAAPEQRHDLSGWAGIDQRRSIPSFAPATLRRGEAKAAGRVELAIYDDRGGVQAPAKYTVEYHDGQAWREAARQVRSPAAPVGGQINEVRFTPVKARRLRVVFTHKGKARSGVTEVLVLPE